VDVHERSGLLAMTDPVDLIALADHLIDVHGEPSIVHPPETALLAMQVREPVVCERFQIGDVLVTSAEVVIAGAEGWAMRMGGDRAATLAAAICAGVADHGLDGSGLVDDLCRRTADRIERERLHEWAELAATAVEFEELD
jgi:alpha-D-ribose 1-methylphosphonate 5-triphosphate synthase subunit PhnG